MFQCGLIRTKKRLLVKGSKASELFEVPVRFFLIMFQSSWIESAWEKQILLISCCRICIEIMQADSKHSKTRYVMFRQQSYNMEIVKI